MTPASLVRLFVALLGVVAPAAGQTIRVTGSDTMLLLNKAWAAEYQRINRDASVQIIGGGTQVGLRAMLDRKTEIAASSRPYSGAEKERFKQATGKDLIEINVAMDVIAIYVHDGNQVPRLTMQELKDIFTGKITYWNQVGGRKQPIYTYIRGTNSGTHVYFKEHVLEGAAYSPRARHVETTAELTEIISYNSNAIGFGGYAYGKATRRMPLATAAEPLGHTFDPDHVTTGDYPLHRGLYFYVNPDAVTPDLKKFVRWVLGEEGQSIVAGVGYFAFSKTDAAKELERLGWAEKSALTNSPTPVPNPPVR